MTLTTQQVAKMDERTLAALKSSIEAWERKLAATDPWAVELGPTACPLCHLFNTADTADGEYCQMCPVSISTGKAFCAGSPYPTAATALLLWHNWRTAKARDEWRAAAQAEIDFLRSLLPKEDKP